MKRIAALSLVALLVAAPARADRLFTCGFEENNLTQTMWDGAGAQTSAVTTTPHSGTYALQVTDGSGKSADKSLTTSVTSGTHFWRFYWRTNSTGIVDSKFFHDRNGSGTFVLEVYKLSTGKIRLRNVITGSQVDSTAAISANTWYRFEIRHLLSDTVGEMEVRFYLGDSTTPIETLLITGEDTLNTNLKGFTLTEATANSSLTYLFDDVAWNNDAGSFQNTWPGPGKIALVKPSSDVSVAWTKSGSSPAATNFGGVSEVPGTPDDGVTYNASTSGTQTDQLGITSLPAEVPSDADIILVDLYGRQGSNGTSGTRTITYEIWDESSVNTHGPTCSASINGWRIAATNEHQVFDAGSRTRANINGFSIGYRRTGSGTTEERVTALWANVEWTTSSALATARRAVIQW